MQHPATLNVALPKGIDWTTRKDFAPVPATNHSRASHRLRGIVRLSVEEIEKNARYFINFMTERKIGGGR